MLLLVPPFLLDCCFNFLVEFYQVKLAPLKNTVHAIGRLINQKQSNEHHTYIHLLISNYCLSYRVKPELLQLREMLNT